MEPDGKHLKSSTFKINKMKIDRKLTAEKLQSIAQSCQEMALHILINDPQDYDINCAVGGIKARLEILSKKLQETVDSEKPNHA